MTTISLATPFLSRPQRRKIRKWKFSLHDSLVTIFSHPSLSSTNRIRWLRKARGRRLELILNKPGSLTFNVPTGSDEAQDIFHHELVRCIVAWAENKSGIYEPIWSGPIWTTEADEPGGKLNVTCVGWEELLEHRELRRDTNFQKVRNGELVQAICNIINNQHANEAYGLGKSAEDLLYGNGDFEETGTWQTASGTAWTALGQVGIGEFPQITSGVAPAALAGTQDVPPSGSKWLRTRLAGTSPGNSRGVYVISREGLSVEGGKPIGFGVEPGETYLVSGTYRGTTRQFGNGVFPGSAAAEIGVSLRWWDDTGAAVGTAGYQAINSGNQEWSEMSGFNAKFTAPSGATRASLILFASTGNLTTVAPVAGAGTVDVLWDNIVVTKGDSRGQRYYPLRGGFDDPYILNQMSDASFETGFVWATWNIIGATTTRAVSTEWSNSGKNSLKVSSTAVAAQSEVGVRYQWSNGPGTSGSEPLYWRCTVRVLTPGFYGMKARIKFDDAVGTVYATYETEFKTGAGVKELEIYIPDVSVVDPAATRLNIEVISYAFTGEAPVFYMDDMTLAQEHPPVPYYEGGQQSARFYDRDGFGRGMRSLGPVFTRSYTKGTKLAQILREMTEIEWGIDYRIHPLDRQFEVFWDVLIPGTTLRGRGQDRSDLIFGYNIAPFNLGNIREAHDASRLKNRVNTQGKVGWGLAQDMASIEKYSIHEETIPLTDVADPPPPQPSILAVYAGSEVAMFSRPFKLYTIQPKKYIAGSGVPMFGVDYDIGDLARLRSNGKLIKVGVPGSEHEFHPHDLIELYDNFNRANGAVNTGAGAGIWSSSAAIQGQTLGINVTSNMARSNKPSGQIGTAMMTPALWPQFDLIWVRPTVQTGDIMDVYWAAGSTGGTTMGTDYNRMRWTSGATFDSVEFNGSLINNSVAKQGSQSRMWFQKRDEKIRIFGSADNVSPWILLAEFDAPLGATSGFGFVGFGLSVNAMFDDLYSYEWTYAVPDTVPPEHDYNSPQLMRIFGANISIDDNNDGETIDSLTTALSA